MLKGQNKRRSKTIISVITVIIFMWHIEYVYTDTYMNINTLFIAKA
jgi:hypothetical protein